MFDFHIHVAGAGQHGLLPAEAIHLAKYAGFQAIGLIIRADPSTLDLTLPRIVPLVRTCSIYANITVFAGVELVHVPPALLSDAVAEARGLGAALVLAHGEGIPHRPVDSVEQGTNCAAIAAGVDILAHPGLITRQDAQFAAEKDVLLELNTAPRHSLANGHIAAMARQFGCGLAPGSDATSAGFFQKQEAMRAFYRAAALGAGLTEAEIMSMNTTSRNLVQRLLRQ